MNIKTTFTFAIAIFAVSVVHSTDELSLSHSVWTKKVYQLATSGNAKKGEKLAKKCAACHGDNGVSEDNETPSLAGQRPAYTFKQIYDYRHKIRQDKTMYKKVKKLSYQNMADISAWYQLQKGENRVGKNPPTMVANGDEKRFLIACELCHNPNVMPGGFQVPVLEGQKIDYLIDTLTAFKAGDRDNDEYGVMRDIAKLLSDEEIQSIAKYYAAKPIADDE